MEVNLLLKSKGCEFASWDNETSLVLRDIFTSYDKRVLPYVNGPVVVNMTIVLGILIELVGELGVINPHQIWVKWNYFEVIQNQKLKACERRDQRETFSPIFDMSPSLENFVLRKNSKTHILGYCRRMLEALTLERFHPWYLTYIHIYVDVSGEGRENNIISFRFLSADHWNMKFNSFCNTYFKKDY